MPRLGRGAFWAPKSPITDWALPPVVCGDWPPSASEAPKFTQVAQPSPIWGLSILPSKPKNEGGQTHYEKLSKSEKQENHQFGVMHEPPPFIAWTTSKLKITF
jgi:hypothetical protein